ncbi:Dihydrolipoyl dehydrogenase [Phytophthora nicotianae]|uniref:Dihydrolipoyl dehydrogenase n=1 Tax=Phytophthora nicotianae TaxID=4792 RepID=A0A0W8DQK8_PHYNI|nr:Dihydrolipoyl dehydrogenase [Phytophthora nicotianae]
MPTSDPAPSEAAPAAVIAASSALPTSPSSAPDAESSPPASAASNDALEVTNVPESLYVASSPKSEAPAAVSRFTPFEESYDDMNELRRALKVLSVQKNAPYYMQHSSPQRVEARCPSWRQRKRRSGSNNDSEVAAIAVPVCDFVVSANRHANGRVYVTRAIFNHSPTCSILHARLAANAEAVTVDANVGDNGLTHAGMLRTDVIPRIFLMTSLKTLYAGRITPIDIATVPSDEVTIPHTLPKSRGRPRKVQQIQQFGDPKQEKLRCSVCGVKGHNKRTCKRLAGGAAPDHTDDMASGQDDTTFLVSTYGDALAFDNSALGTDSESHVSDGQSLHLSSGKRRRLEENDNAEEKKSDEEEETTGVALV